MKILLPVDGSKFTKRMLSYVAAHEELFGTQHDYIFVTVVGAVPPHVTHYLDRTAIDSYYADEAQKVLKPVTAFAAQHGWKSRSTHAVGQAAPLLADLAKAENVDLVVMGSHGHSALGNLVLGSVASGVLARCSVPVLLIR